MAGMEKRSSPRETVLNFAKAWTDWEIEMAKDVHSSLENPDMKQRHAELIAEFCTIKKRAYIDGLKCFSIPPIYQSVSPENVYCVDFATPTRAFVDTRGGRKFHRFVVLKKKDGWRIDSVKWKVVESDEWTNGLIGV